MHTIDEQLRRSLGDPKALRQIYDSVLLYSIRQVQDALDVVHDTGVDFDHPAMAQLRDLLKVMEAERDRRGLTIDSSLGESAPIQ